MGKIKEPGRALEIRPQLSGQARVLVSEWTAGSKRSPPVRVGQSPQLPPCPPLRRGCCCAGLHASPSSPQRQGPSALRGAPNLSSNDALWEHMTGVPSMEGGVQGSF